MTICTPLTRRTASAWLTAALAGCVDLTPAYRPGSVLSTRVEQRMTDEAVRRDWAAMEALRARIAAVRPVARQAYAVARAEAQLDWAIDEYEENDRTGLVDMLLDDALRLVRTQEPGHVGPVDLALPALPAVKMLREDLWLQARHAREDEALLHCAGEAIARLEVALLEYGHEQVEVDLGLNAHDHAQPYGALVDSLAAALARAVAACHAPARPDAPGPMPPPQIPPSTPILVLFRFDEYGRDQMLPDGRAQLDALAAELAGAPAAWRRLTLRGHADRLGSHAYNLGLSLRRAQTVREHLVLGFGLPAARIEVHGLGATQPLVYCTGPRGERLYDCLQANRRVEIEVHR